MSKILLGITVDDKIYEEYASHKYVIQCVVKPIASAMGI